MSYSLIVVDDEVNIREGIRDFIMKKESEFEVVGCFADGKDAMEYISQNDVQAVITDVKMLNISGIELAKFIYEAKPDIKVIILSGYREFEYARSAVAYNVEHYLLKPTDFTELKDALTQIKTKLDEDEQQKKQVAYYEKVLPMLKEELLSDLVMGALKDEQELVRRFELLEIGVDPLLCGCCMVKLNVENYEQYLTERWDYGKDNLNIAIKNFIEKQNTQTARLYHISNNYNYIKFICILNETDKNKMKAAIKKHIDDVELCSKENLRLKLNFEAGEMFSSVSAVLAKSHTMQENETADVMEDKTKLLLSHINLGNYDEVNTILDSLTSSIKTLPLNEARRVSMQLVDGIIIKLTNEYNNLPADFDIKDFTTQIEKISENIQLWKYVRQAFGTVVGGMVSVGEEASKTIINRARTYMKNNFNKDISLEDVAKHVFLNPAYFSRYYKKYTDENFSTYLLTLRMDCAKQMIMGDYTIDRIAEECGYGSSRYFVKIFKEYTGFTPSTFRRQLMQNGRI